MLSKSDKQFIREVVRQEVEAGVLAALTLDITLEKVRDEKTGQPLATKEVKTENVFLPSLIIQMLPFHEGALKGLQADVEKNNNKINMMTNQVESVGKILLQAEESFKSLAAISSRAKQIEYEKSQDVNIIDVEEKK